MNETKESNNYKYAAFISYRHTELDKYVAEKIHRYLESFELPKSVKNKKGLKRTKIERVFRDKEELTITNNLEDPIIQALKNSEYLIVICSPRTKESIWCRKEIEKFIEFHGRSKILTVLIEGDPSQSFPEELLIDEEIVRENGITSVHRKDIEPLAADIRAESKGKMNKLLKTELLRIIAPMFGLEYNDLRQRHRERKIKRIITATVSAAIVGAAIGVAGIASAIVINSQKDKISNQNIQIEEQNKVLLNNQANNLAENAMQYLEQDRIGEALKFATSSVTEYEGIKMPYTFNGRYALTMTLRPYDAGSSYRAKYQFMTQAAVADVKLSNDRTHLVVCDKANNAYVWDVVTSKLLTQIKNVNLYADIGFVGDSQLVYNDNKGNVKLKDYVNNEEDIILENAEYTYGLKANKTGTYIAIVLSDLIKIYDVANKEFIHEIEFEITDDLDSNIVWSDDKLVYLIRNITSIDNEKHTDYSINVYDVVSGDVISVDVDFECIVNAKSMDGIMFVLASRLHKDKNGNIGELLAINEVTGQVVWHNQYKDIPGETMYIGKLSGEIRLFVASYSTFYCIDGQTGANCCYQDITEGIEDYIVNVDGSVNMLSSEGRLFRYNIYSEDLQILDYLFKCNVDNISSGYIYDNGFLVVPLDSNYIVKYEIYENEDRELVEVSDEEEEKYFSDWHELKDYAEIAEQLGVSNPNLVEYILYVDDNNTALITYLDMSLVVYDVNNKKIINTIKDIKSAPLKDFGKDYEGDLYVAGDNYGYIFDKDYNVLAEIQNMVYVDVEEGYIYVGDLSALWKYPIYSFDEIKEMALEAISQ